MILICLLIAQKAIASRSNSATLSCAGFWQDALLYPIHRGDIVNAISASLALEIRVALQVPVSDAMKGIIIVLRVTPLNSDF